MIGIFSLNNIHALIEWMSIAITQNKHHPKAEITNWSEFYSLIVQHGLDAVFLPVVESLPEDRRPDVDLLTRWKNKVSLKAAIQLLNFQQMQNMMNVFEQSQIPVIVLKGASIARFYTYPEYRMMGDLDILIQEEDHLKAKQVIESMGYSIIGKKTTPMHVGFQKENMICIELHSALFRPNFLGLQQMDDWYKHIWEFSEIISFNNLKFRAMQVEDELINQILHFTRHFITGKFVSGKNLFDIAVIVHQRSEELDWQYIKQILEKAKLIKIGRLILAICQKYFHITIPEMMVSYEDVAPEEFIINFLSAYTIENKPGAHICWDFAYRKMPILFNHTVMLPIIWVVTVLVQFKIHTWGIKNSLINSWYNTKTFESKARTIRKLGLFVS